MSVVARTRCHFAFNAAGTVGGAGDANPGDSWKGNA